MSKFSKGVSKLFCFFPLVFLVVQVLIFIFNHKFYYAYFLGRALGGWENGIIEQLTNIFLFLGVIISFASIVIVLRSCECKVKNLNLAQKVLLAWLLLYFSGCLYFLGEEMSWGQHMFNWMLPENSAWHNINSQKETNLHNLKGIWESLFNRLPKLLLTIFVLVIGLILPLIERFNKKTKDLLKKPVISLLYARPEIYINSAISVLLVLLGRKIFQVYKTFVHIDRGVWYDYRVSSEVFELFMSIFLAAYAFSVLLKLLDSLNLYSKKSSSAETSDKKR